MSLNKDFQEYESFLTQDEESHFAYGIQDALSPSQEQVVLVLYKSHVKWN